MLKIKRLGRRSFEVYRDEIPIGIVRFLRELQQWSYRVYPSPDPSVLITERRGSVLRVLLCVEGEYCSVERDVSA